jgi:hypothetical protein
VQGFVSFNSLLGGLVFHALRFVARSEATTLDHVLNPAKE